MIEDDAAVALKRELGGWIETRVDIGNKIIHCNCENFNICGFCRHCATARVLVFDEEPLEAINVECDNWVQIKTACKRVLRETYILIR